MLKNMINKVTNFTKEHTPEILIGTGMAGMLTGTILAVKATPKAIQQCEDAKADMGVTYLTRKEIVQCTWKTYIPATVSIVGGATAIIAGTSKFAKKNTALATVYALSESTLKNYKKETKAIVGEETAKEIDKAVAKAVKQDTYKGPVIETRDSEYIISTPFGDTLIYDTLSGRYFRSSMNAVDAAVNSINKSLLNEYMMTVNDFYNELEIPTVGFGSLLGWKSEVELMEVSFDSDVDMHGNAYLVLSYSNRPMPLYSRAY